MTVSYKSISELRAFIETCIQENTQNINYEDLLAQAEFLNEVGAPEGIEVIVLLGCFLKKDAKKTFIMLSKYRDFCHELGKADYFAAFKARCDMLVAPRILTPHGYRIPIGTENTEILTDGILTVVEAMKGIGYDIFINSGTLLGVVRAGTFIPHDDDIDFGVVLHSSNAADAAAEWIALKVTLEKVGLLKNIGWLGGILKTHKIGTFTVDFFPAWVEDGLVYVYPHTAGTLSSEDLLPLRMSDKLGLPIPNTPQKMLAINYGPNWQTPDPLFKFNWGKSKKKFDAFLSITKVLDPREAKS